MHVFGWSPDTKSQLDAFIKKWTPRSERKIAVFDADGTLWGDDIGEGFFRYQIKNDLIPKSNYENGVNLWEHYKQLREESAIKAFGWLAQLQKGVPEEQVRVWSKNHFATFNKNIFMDVAKFILQLKRAGFEIWVCSASIRWAVEPGAQALDIDNVLAIETEVANGIVTDKVILPLPYQEGKALALKKALGGQIPQFVAGNSSGDTAMLELSSDLRLSICSAGPENDHYQSECDLHAVALDRGWLIQDFRASWKARNN